MAEVTSSSRWQPDPYAGVPPIGELVDNGRNSPEPFGSQSDPERGNSWRPVDLGPILRGEHTRPEPTVGLCRDDGLRLLYPGLEHAVIGETECGKSWLASACVKAELDAGNHVVYCHWEEGDPVGTVERLQALGVADDVLLSLFRFVAPNEPVSPEWLAALLDPVPTLVIHDGVNEAMAACAMETNSTDGVAAFRRRLVKPCTAVGAAVLACDHVVKDSDRRGRYAMGSIHKGNGLTGSLLVMENSEPFGRGRRGASHVFITKDRPGHLRRHGTQSKLPGKTFVGTLVVDDERSWKSYLDLAFIEPPETPPADTTTQDERDDEHALEIVHDLADKGLAPTLRKVRAESKLRNTATADALERLVIAGKLSEATGSRGSRVFRVQSVTGSGSRPKGRGNREPVTGPVPGNRSEPVGTTQDDNVIQLGHRDTWDTSTGGDEPA